MCAVAFFPVVSLVFGLWFAPTTAQPAATSSTLVKIDSGAVRGVAAGGVISFKGIPYAGPTGRRPSLAGSATGEALARRVLTADKFGPECMPADKVRKSEDCLTLNVWRPAASRPGRSQSWCGFMAARSCMARRRCTRPMRSRGKGVIVVSMNYRIGPARLLRPSGVGGRGA